MNKVWIILLVVLIIGAGGYFLMMGRQTMYTAPATTTTQVSPVVTTMPAAMEQTIILAEQNNSSESGTATLTEKDGKVVVTLNMTGAPSDVPQPAHIHTGACPNVGAIVYPLTNLINGKSETTLDVTLAQIAAQQPLGLNVHKSVPETKVYVSCGDLAIPASTSETSTTVPTSSPASSAPATGNMNKGY